MLPVDRNGEYTPEEVKAALSGVSGSRQMTYHYARLDQNNNYLEDIDFVQSGTIENNSLADIKRTAKFKILDTGTINYLHDRIMPYVRLTMPNDETYSEAVTALDPLAWWKMDDAGKVIPAQTQNYPADTLAYQTAETAYPVDANAHTYTELPIQAGSATVRQTAWLTFNVTNSEALQIWPSIRKVDPPNIGVAVVGTIDIFHRTTVEGELELVHHFDVADFMGAYQYDIPFPMLGYYYVKLSTTETVSGVFGSVGVKRPQRLEDSSGNQVYGIADDTTVMRNAAIVGDNGYSLSSGSASISIETSEDISDLGLKVGGGFTINYWEDSDLGGSHYSHLWNTANGSFYFNRANDGTETTQYHMSASYDDGDISGYHTRQIYVTKTALPAGPKMTTITFSPTGIKAYSNGTLVAETEIPVAFEGSEKLYGDILRKGSTSIMGTYKEMDDYSVFRTALSAGDISKLYAIGSSNVSSRSGYVQWPQGVFVLSSPTRTMEDGNVVTREVEGYDQLVILKEDSFDYRYSVKAGSIYTDAIYEVLQSAKTLFSMPTTESYWSLEGNAKITSSNSIRLDTVDANHATALASGFALRGIQVSARIDAPTTPSTATTFMQINYYTDPAASGVMLRIEKEGSSIKFNVDGHAYVETWNAVNDAYWRMRESGGFFYFETSANRVTWAVRRKVKLSVPTYIQANIQLTADHGQALIGSGFNEISATGYAMVVADITKSSAKLLTAMEWEPGTPKLTIINDLLAAINYQSATYSEGGNFLGRPYISPADRTPQYRYATDAESVISGDVDQTMDMFAVPNKWIVVVSDPDRPALVGEYTNDDPHSPTSTVSRGRTIVDYRTEQSAPDQLTLDAQAARLAFEASQVYEAIEFKTGNMPIHQNNDVYELAVDGLGIDGKYSEISWSMELKSGAMMSHKVRKVVSV